MLRRLGPALALLLGLALAACSSSTTKRLLISANEAQDSAAKTYETAKALEMDASSRCRAALVAAGKPLPATPQQIQPICQSVGVPIPYDPVKLQNAAGPINALYDAVRSANAARTLPSGEQVDLPAEVFLNLSLLFQHVVTELMSAGIAVPQSVLDVVATLKAAEGTKP